jgi:ubiquinone/menaquinone biosynthesis C-methylase UbiE
MTRAHSDTVQSQFDPQAQAYLQSAVHASGPDLLRAREIISQTVSATDGTLLDLGCGAGHLSFALAPALKSVTAVDPSPGMLATVAGAAADRKLGNIATCQAGAEHLPFEDGQFHIVATRYSAHHWLDLPSALKEMRRVVKPGGHVLIIDLEGDENALVDTHLQAMELLRDLSHVRDRTPSEWNRLLSTAGFAGVRHESWPTRLVFTPWVTRMRTSPERVSMIRTLQQESPHEVRAALALEEDGSFTARTGLWWGNAG